MRQLVSRPSIIVVLAIVLAALMPARWSFGTASLIRGQRPSMAFVADARGRTALVSEEWVLTPSEKVGLITAVAVCNETAFLVDTHRRIVHRVDLPTGTFSDTFGTTPEGGTVFQYPDAMASDCPGRRLYVSDHKGIFVLDMDSGSIVQFYPKPPLFTHGLGAAILDRENEILYVPGLWVTSTQDWLIKPPNTMFDGDRIGLMLDLRQHNALPMLPAVERGCWTSSHRCFLATMDKSNDPNGIAWVAAQEVGTRVGFFDAEYRLVRSLDVRSPAFLEDGLRVAPSASVETKIRWGDHNSVIQTVYAFGETIVVIHSVHKTKDWHLGDQYDFDVFANLYSFDGSGLIGDLSLPDLPVGRDEASLYVVSYGPGGRRHLGSDPLTLSRILVADLESGVY